MHACVDACTYLHMYIRTYLHAYNIYMHACIHIYIHNYIHTYILNMHTCICGSLQCNVYCVYCKGNALITCVGFLTKKLTDLKILLKQIIIPILILYMYTCVYVTMLCNNLLIIIAHTSACMHSHISGYYTN